jgi:hypothetical protein
MSSSKKSSGVHTVAAVDRGHKKHEKWILNKRDKNGT